MQGGVPPPASNTTYLLPTYENIQKLLSELSNVQTSSLGMMAPPSVLKKKGEWNNQPMILELYRQLMHILFNLEAEENTKTGQISVQPEVQLLVTKIWNDIWKPLNKRNKFLKKKREKAV